MEERPTMAKFEILDLSRILAAIMANPNGLRWSLDFATTVELWYRRFLYLSCVYPNELLVPTEEIDEFWHLHILDTQKYHRDCSYLFGQYLHHFPYLGQRGSDDRILLKKEFAKTLAFFREQFGDDPVSALQRLSGSEYSVEAHCGGSCGRIVAQLEDAVEGDWPHVFPETSH